MPLFLPARGFALSTTSAPLPGTHVCPSRAAACVLLSLDLCHKILLSWQVLMVDNIPPDFSRSSEAKGGTFVRPLFVNH